MFFFLFFGHGVLSIMCEYVLVADSQAAEEQVSRLCLEAQESMVRGRWLDLASLMLTSADLMFTKVSDKGKEFFCMCILNVLHTKLTDNLSYGPCFYSFC